ncbi:hypothetical protein EVAR_101431_1 [Eumeta japonica]|uniref:Uncharacterized protein n=1 Tax=Eumeta variegata TaxID=151549 RepID=A0A4C1TS73_EUMVA|nr:hypothetical protein EVAR_101431_1 [Eumeta japonica]
MLTNQQHQMRQVRVSSNSGVSSLPHQTPPSPLQQQQQHQQRLIGQTATILPGIPDNMSPAPIHLHLAIIQCASPYMSSQHSHQQLLSPSTTHTVSVNCFTANASNCYLRHNHLQIESRTTLPQFT